MIRQSSLGTTSTIFLLLLIVCIAPLPFGSVLLRERTALDILACLALATAVLQSPRPTRSAAFAPAALIATIAVLGLLQSMSWPQSVAALLGPGLTASWSSTAEFLGQETAAVPLSLAPGVSRQVAIHWLAVAAALWAAGLVGADRQNRRTLALGLLAVAILEVIYGANLWIARSTRIWGLEVGGSPNRLRGTYINPDHLAFLLAIVTTCCFAWIWWALRRAMRHGPIEQRLLHTLLPGLFFLLFFAGLIFTGSRAGLVAITAAIVLQAACLMMFHRRWHVVATAGGAIALCGLAVSWFGYQGGLGRLLSTSAYEVTWNHRIKVYGASLELWQDFPLLGTGLGTFRQAFPRVQPAGLDSTWNHAHSDFLEILVTNGVVGLILACLGVVLVGRHLWHLYRRGERSEDRATGLAAFGALLATTFHSMVDFGLTMPANSFILAIVLGAALAATPRRTPPPGTAGRSATGPLPQVSIDELDGPQRGGLTGQRGHLQEMRPRLDGER